MQMMMMSGFAKTVKQERTTNEMNCKNCKCVSCIKDRSRSDLKAHRLTIIGGWSWNASPREAAESLLAEAAAGRGGSVDDWMRDCQAELNERDFLSVAKILGYYNGT